MYKCAVKRVPGIASGAIRGGNFEVGFLMGRDTRRHGRSGVAKWVEGRCKKKTEGAWRWSPSKEKGAGRRRESGDGGS